MSTEGGGEQAPSSGGDKDTELFLKGLTAFSSKEKCWSDYLRMWKHKKSVYKKKKNTTAQQLHSCFAILQQEYLPNIAQQQESDDDYIMERIATVIRFVQLLFAWSKDHPNESNLTVGQVNKMAVTLLQNLSRALVANPNKDDSLYVVAIGSLLRGINPLVESSRLFLLSPLYKGICEISTKIATTMPTLLANEALSTLHAHLSQGRAQILSTPQQQQNSNAQQQIIKVLSFLVGRVGIMLPLAIKDESLEERPDDSVTSNVVSEMLDVLVSLRGIAATRDTLEPYKGLGNKAEACLVKAMIQSEPPLFHEAALRLLLSVSPQDGDAALGKLLTMSDLLQRAIQSLERVHDHTDTVVAPLISICEELLFSTLPYNSHLHLTTSGSSILEKTIKIVSLALIQCNDHADSINQIKLYGLWARWLATPPNQSLHFLTRHAVVSVVTSLILHPLKQKPSSPRSVAATSTTTSLLQVVVKLSLDPRAQVGHRRNLVGVLLRIIVHESDDNTSRSAQQLVACELVHKSKSIVSNNKKRKRNWKSGGLDFAWLSTYSMESIDSICRLVERIPVSLLPPLDWKSFCHQVARNSVSDGKTLGGKPHKLSCFLISLLMGVVSSSRAEQDFMSCAGLALPQFRDALVAWIARVWGSVKNANVAPSEGCVVIVVTALRFVANTLNSLGQTAPIDKVPGFDALLKTCLVDKSILAAGSISEEVVSGHLKVSYELVALLGAIGSAVSPSCSPSLLQAIALTFKSLFETKDWPIVAFTMTSLVRFASVLPSSYQHILPQCLSMSNQKLLQCRLQGMACTYDDAFLGTSREEFLAQCSKLLLQLVPGHDFRKPVLATNSDIVVVPGSYVLSMPTNTKGGRTALVIFPPGEASKDDIAAMLGDNSETQRDIYKLQRAMLQGQACRFVVKEDPKDNS